MPRPYRLGQREAAAEQTHARIIAAARELLMAEDASSDFSVDAVARRAGVARMTVYNQFGSRAGLLEAVFDDLAARGGMGELPNAFRQPDPLDALAGYLAVFGRFWAADRRATRRLRGLAALDAELGRALQARDERRRAGVRVILGRIAERHGRPIPARFDEAVDVLTMLTSFESFDALAGPARSPEEVVPLVQRLALAVIGLGSQSAGSLGARASCPSRRPPRTR